MSIIEDVEKELIAADIDGDIAIAVAQCASRYRQFLSAFNSLILKGYSVKYVHESLESGEVEIVEWNLFDSDNNCIHSFKMKREK